MRRKIEIEEDDIPKSVRRMKNQKNKNETSSRTSRSKRNRKDEQISPSKSNSRRTRKKQKNIDKEISPRKRKIKKIIKILILLFILALIIYFIVATIRWRMLAKDMLLNQNSIVFDIDENEIARLGETKKKITVSSDEIPDDLKNAYVAIEDERFYEHHGIDAKRTGSAILSYITHFGKSSFGGSTITQQLVKNMTGDNNDSAGRKIKEWWRAWELESCSSKDDILTGYLNMIYTGPNIYGIEAGAKYYFNKSCSDLTLEECAFMAGINNSPNSYNPFVENNENNLEKINKRTKLVLGKMKELDYISNSEYETAISNLENGLNFEQGEIDAGNGVYSYHTDALINELTSDLSKRYNISNQFAYNYLENAGLKIYSTQNTEIQKETEKEFEKSKYILQSNYNDSTSQAAMVIIDHKKGYVVACAGGLGEKTESRVLNRATQSIRQTGSAMKPLAVLAPALDKKIITNASIYDDTEQDFEDGYHPVDYNKPLGDITVRRAVESSQNVPFVEIMEELTPKKSIKYLKKMGITTLTKKDETLSLALGGLDKGISPLQMAAGYSTIANDGVYIEPTFYKTIEKRNGKTLLKSKQKKKKVFSKEVAYILKELLTQPVLGENGTANYCKISGVDVAAKTGTTDDNFDRWLCGFTPYYTAATWYGFDQNETINYGNKNPAGLIWANVMSRIHSGLPSDNFEKPDNVYAIEVCAETGKQATTGCPHTYTEYFLKKTLPKTCNKHSGDEIDTTTESKKNTGTIQGSETEIDEEEPPRLVTPEPTYAPTQTTTSKPSPTPTKPPTPIPSPTPTPSPSPSPTPEKEKEEEEKEPELENKEETEKNVNP